jgi:hypothetical protein
MAMRSLSLIRGIDERANLIRWVEKSGRRTAGTPKTTAAIAMKRALRTMGQDERESMSRLLTID